MKTEEKDTIAKAGKSAAELRAHLEDMQDALRALQDALQAPDADKRREDIEERMRGLTATSKRMNWSLEALCAFLWPLLKKKKPHWTHIG